MTVNGGIKMTGLTAKYLWRAQLMIVVEVIQPISERPASLTWLRNKVKKEGSFKAVLDKAMKEVHNV
jgi:ABC-type transporter MlaC component